MTHPTVSGPRFADLGLSPKLLALVEAHARRRLGEEIVAERRGHAHADQPPAVASLSGRRMAVVPAEAIGADVTIISSDKDLMQLVRPGVAMYDPASGDAKKGAGFRAERKIGEPEVVEYLRAQRVRTLVMKQMADAMRDPAAVAARLSEEGLQTLNPALVRQIELMQRAGDRAADALPVTMLGGADGAVDGGTAADDGGKGKGGDWDQGALHDGMLLVGRRGAVMKMLLLRPRGGEKFDFCTASALRRPA